MAIKNETTKAVYETLQKVFAELDIMCTKNEEHLAITCLAQGDDLPIPLTVLLRDDSETMLMVSRMPFDVPQEKRIDAAVAVCVANQGMANGSFDLDISDGGIQFRVATAYKGGTVSPELIKGLLSYMIGMSDMYNDRFFMLAQGSMTLDKFIALDGTGGGN